MTGGQTSTREKLGSIFFAVVMVTSMMAIGGAAFAGTASAASTVDSGSYSTNPVDEDSSFNGETVTYQVDDVDLSDGNTDTFQVTIPNAIAEAGSLSVSSANLVDSDGTSYQGDLSVSSSPVDGPDGDGVQDTLEFTEGVSSGPASANVEVTFTYSFSTPIVTEDTAFSYNASVVDSNGDSITQADIGADLTVSNADSSVADGSVVNTNTSEEFDTIQDAIDDSNTENGDIIEVSENGSEPYSAFTASSGLTIQAADGENPEVLADSSRVELGSSTTVSGLTFDLDGQQIYFGGSDDITFEDNVVEISDESEYGIRAEASSGITIQNNEFTQEEDTADDGSFSQAILLSGSQDAVIEANSFSGPEVAPSNPQSFSNAEVDGDLGFAVYVVSSGASPSATVQDNTITGFGQGIVISETGNELGAFTVEGNDVSSNEYEDFLFAGTSGSLNGESSINAGIQAVLNDNDGIDTTNPYAVEVSPTQAAIGSTATVEGTLLGTGDNQRSVSYEVQEPGSGTAASGSTSDASFSALVEFTESGDYEVALTSETGDPAATITSAYAIDNQTVDPAEPTLGDDVTVSGQVVDSEGGVDVGTIAIANEGAAPGDTPIATASTTSSGQFQVQTTIDDADEFELRNVTGGNLGAVYGNFTVGPADANVTLESDGDNNAGFAQTYTVTAQDGNGNAIDFTGDFEGYVNVTGEFSGTPSLVADSDSDALETYNTDDDSAVEVIRVDPDADGDFQLDATPTADGGPVTATLENNDGPAAIDVTSLGDNEVYDGIEETANGDSPDAPDYVGSDELAVESAGNLNVDVTTSPSTVFSTEDSTVTVDVVGADGNPPDGADNSNDLSNATVSVSGPGVDVDDKVIDTNDNSNSGNPASFSVNPDEAGELTIDVTAVADDGTEYSTNETVDVTGDLIESVSPTDVAIEDNENVTVEVASANGQAVNNRDVTISSQGNAAFSVDETTGVSEVIIDASAGEVRDTSTSNVLQSISVNDGQYTVNNVTFTAPGDLDVTVASGGAATDQDSNTARQTAAINVQGVEAYDVAVDKEPLVTGVTETVNVSVTEDGAAVNGSALDDLTRSISQNDASVASNIQTVDTNDDNTVDVIQADVTPTATDSAVNVSVSTSNQARTGSTSVNVEAPVIATNVTDNTLTERLTTTAELTVENPRTDEQIDNADIQFTVFNGTAAVEGDANGGFSGEDSSSDGSGADVVTTGDLADGNTTVDLQAYSPADDGDFVVSLGAQVDGDYVTATNLSVEPMQVTASPESITLGETATVTVNARDANGNAIANQRVDIDGAGVSISNAGTDSGGVVNVVTNPQATGNIGIYVDSDSSVAGSTPASSGALEEGALEAEIPVQTEQQATFGINEGTLEPNTVTGNQTVTHTLTYSVDSLSNDGNSDTFTVTLPSSVEITGANSVSVTDANGSAIQVSSSPSLSDANGGTNNQVQFGIQPGDSALDTSTVTVEASIDVAFPAVEESVTAPVNASVADSSAGSTGPTTVADVTIEPEGPAPTASVTFDNQTIPTGSSTVTVDSATLSDGGFVAIHSTPVVNETQNITAVDSVVGVSEYLENGTSENITVTLNEPVTENQTLVAMPHLDTNGNETYDFVTSGGEVDGPYTANGAPVTDSASITVEEVDAPVVIGDSPATDTDGDGTFEDVNGDGEFDIVDINALFQNRNSDVVQNNTAAFDFNGDGEFNIVDVNALFQDSQA